MSSLVSEKYKPRMGVLALTLLLIVEPLEL